MKPGIGSQTAIFVCIARAMAHGNTDVAQFSDPTALALLPESAREHVERMRSGAPPATRRERFERKMLEKRTAMMIARTVAIDEIVRAAASPQVVILGAGYDGRAWRMPELENVAVFEVDHPDTQREKRTRTPGLRQAAREVHFVPVDFSRDDLGDALAAAGHDPSLPTTWIWEGVVMYLERADIEATLSVIARRSAPGSRLTIAYVAPVLLRWLIGLMLRRIGEPFRSIFSADQMREMLARHGFRADSDEDIVAIAKRLSPALERDARAIRHLRIVTAEKS